jgi:hypothetical protein
VRGLEITVSFAIGNMHRIRPWVSPDNYRRKGTFVAGNEVVIFGYSGTIFVFNPNSKRWTDLSTGNRGNGSMGLPADNERVSNTDAIEKELDVEDNTQENGDRCSERDQHVRLNATGRVGSAMQGGHSVRMLRVDRCLFVSQDVPGIIESYNRQCVRTPWT